MNKKDLINSFESLTPDQSQKERMLGNVLNAGMKKDVHKVSFKFRHAFTTIAAAACAVVVIITVGPWYGQQEQDQAPQKEISYDVPYNTHGSQIIAKEDTAEPDKSAAADNKTDTVGKVPPEPAENAESKPAEETLPSESVDKQKSADSAENTKVTAQYNIPLAGMALDEDSAQAYTPKLNINSQQVNVYARSKGVESAAEYECSQLTLQEYYNYLGVNVESILDIPEGFTSKINQVGQINKDYEDAWFFEYENGESYIQVRTTKNINEISGFVNDSSFKQSDINGTKAVVIQNDTHYSAYIIADGVGYTINTLNVSEADLANLLLSIAG